MGCEYFENDSSKFLYFEFTPYAKICEIQDSNTGLRLDYNILLDIDDYYICKCREFGNFNNLYRFDSANDYYNNVFLPENSNNNNSNNSSNNDSPNNSIMSFASLNGDNFSLTDGTLVKVSKRDGIFKVLFSNFLFLDNTQLTSCIIYFLEDINTGKKTFCPDISKTNTLLLVIK